MFWPALGGLLGSIGGWYWTRFKHNCTYVGKQGTAHFVCSGTRDNITQDIFLFRDATEIRTTQTSHSTNGIYTHTTFTFQWSDVGGRPRYTISGQYKKSDGNPPSEDFYHFGRAAEVAGTVYLLEGMYRQIELSGTVLFHLAGRQWVRLGPGSVILGLSGEPVECSADETGRLFGQPGSRHDPTARCPERVVHLLGGLFLQLRRPGQCAVVPAHDGSCGGHSGWLISLSRSRK